MKYLRLVALHITLTIFKSKCTFNFVLNASYSSDSGPQNLYYCKMKRIWWPKWTIRNFI